MKRILTILLLSIGISSIAQKIDSLHVDHLKYLYSNLAYHEAYEILNSPIWKLNKEDSLEFDYYALYICKELYKQNPELNSIYLNKAIYYAVLLGNSADTFYIKRAKANMHYLTTEIYNKLVFPLNYPAIDDDSLRLTMLTDETIISFSHFNFDKLETEALNYFGPLFYNEGVHLLMKINIETIAPEEIVKVQIRVARLWRVSYLVFEELCKRDKKYCIANLEENLLKD